MRIQQPPVSKSSELTIDGDIDLLTTYQVKRLAAPASGEALRKGNKDITDAEVSDSAAIALTKLGWGRIGTSKLQWGNGKLLKGAGVGADPTEIDPPPAMVIILKTADQETTSKSLVNDNTLLLPVGVNEVWKFTLYARGKLYSASGASSRLYGAITIPSGASLLWINEWTGGEEDGTPEFQIIYTAIAGATVYNYPRREYLYLGGANAGNIQFQFRITTSGDTGWILANSRIIALKLD